jgi:DNA-binding GntR family transcriptional regulator
MQEHEVMVQALAAHDGAVMRKVLVEHIINKRNTVIDSLRTGDVYPHSATA